MNRIQLDPGILDPDPDDLAPARGVVTGFLLGALAWVVIFGGLAVAVAIIARLIEETPA